MSAVVSLIRAEGPIVRAEIARRLKLSEREVRAEIADAQCRGEPIVFRARQGGFMYARSRRQIDEWARVRLAAVRSEIIKVAKVRKIDLEGIVRELYESETSN
jgi:hypothetical protein